MKLIISSAYYTFDASAKEITLLTPFDAMTTEQIYRIINLTTRAVIYDSERRTHPISMASGVITHTYDSGGMGDTDALQISLDDGTSGGGGGSTWFLVSGTPSSDIGTLDDVAVDQDTGEIWLKEDTSPVLSSTFYPTTGTDDGYWRPTEFNNGAYYGIFGYAGNSLNIFCRFRSLNLDNAAIIHSAYVEFVNYSSDGNHACNANIYLNDVDSAVAPTSIAEADAVALTSAVAWDAVPGWTSSNTHHDTPSIKSLVKAVVDRGGWASGNDMMVLVKDNGSDSNAIRKAILYEKGHSYPALHISWQNPSGVEAWVLKYSPLTTPWIEKTTTYTAITKDRILADTSGGAFTITLPSSASAGDVIRIADANGTFATGNLTVARNGLNIRGAAADVTLNTDWDDIELVYVDATVGWRY